MAPERRIYERKRRHPRHQVTGRDVHAHLLFSEEVVLQNLSVTGACVRSIKDLQVGGRYLLRIQDKQPPLALQGTVIWKHEQGNGEEMFPGYYLAGIRFHSPTFEEIVRLKDFMRMYGEPDDKTVKDSYTPSALRFSIRKEEKAVLNCPEVHPVKKISLGGMLIESSRQMELEGRYLMKILLPFGAEPIKIKGRIASIIPRSDSPKPQYDIGVEFLDMEIIDKARLDRFIHNL